MTKDYVTALVTDYVEEMESGVISPRIFAVKVGNIFADLVKNDAAWDEGIAEAFELAADACYLNAPHDIEAQEWLHLVSDRYEDLRP